MFLRFLYLQCIRSYDIIIAVAYKMMQLNFIFIKMMFIARRPTQSKLHGGNDDGRNRIRFLVGAMPYLQK